VFSVVSVSVIMSEGVVLCLASDVEAVQSQTSAAAGTSKEVSSH